MTDLKLDIWNEWLREKQQKLEEMHFCYTHISMTGQFPMERPLRSLGFPNTI